MAKNAPLFIPGHIHTVNTTLLAQPVIVGCPQCEEHVYRGIIGCVGCVQEAVLAYCYHIGKNHLEHFMADISAVDAELADRSTGENNGESHD